MKNATISWSDVKDLAVYASTINIKKKKQQKN